jgi:hypothetical protein
LRPGRLPNDKRPTDDVAAIELQANVRVTFALVDAAFAPDGVAGVLTDG